MKFEIGQEVSLTGMVLSINEEGTPSEWIHVGVPHTNYGYDILACDLRKLVSDA